MQQKPWQLTSTASLRYRLRLPKEKHRSVQKVQYITENFSVDEYGFQKVVYLADQRKGYMVVKRSAQAMEKMPKLTNQPQVPKEEADLGFVYIPPGLKLQLTDAKTLSITYHRKEKNLFDTFIKQVTQLVKKPDQIYKKKLVLKGLGFRMSLEKKENGVGEKLSLKLGYSHLVDVDIPAFISSVRLKKNILILESTNKVQLGDFAASIQRTKPPETYKEKGIYFAGDKVKLKPIKKK